MNAACAMIRTLQEAKDSFKTNKVTPRNGSKSNALLDRFGRPFRSVTSQSKTKDGQRSDNKSESVHLSGYVSDELFKKDLDETASVSSQSDTSDSKAFNDTYDFRCATPDSNDANSPSGVLKTPIAEYSLFSQGSGGHLEDLLARKKHVNLSYLFVAGCNTGKPSSSCKLSNEENQDENLLAKAPGYRNGLKLNVPSDNPAHKQSDDLLLGWRESSKQHGISFKMPHNLVQMDSHQTPLFERTDLQALMPNDGIPESVVLSSNAVSQTKPALKKTKFVRQQQASSITSLGHPTIKSTLNPNAPDFSCRFLPPSALPGYSNDCMFDSKLPDEQDNETSYSLGYKALDVGGDDDSLCASNAGNRLKCTQSIPQGMFLIFNRINTISKKNDPRQVSDLISDITNKCY